MKRSLQFQRTDRDITVAFIKLITEKPFEKITVNDIVTEAMINRSTFYQHFSDKYAILEELQTKYVEELTSQHGSVLSHGRIDLNQIDKIMESYVIKNRYVLNALLKIKTEHVDILKRWQEYFSEYFQHSSNPPLSKLESDMMANMFVTFLTHYLEHDDLHGKYSTIMFESLFNISLKFFQLDQNNDAQNQFIN